MAIFFIILGVVLLCIIFMCLVIGDKVQANPDNDKTKRKNEHLSFHGIVKCDVEYTFKNPALSDIQYIVDLTVNRICIITDSNSKIAAIHELRKSSPELSLAEAKEVIDKGTAYSLDLGEVSGVEIIEDSEVIGGVGRAIVGGVLAGGVGAVVGAVTAKKHIMSYKVIIYTTDVKNPQIALTLINSKMPTNSAIYKQASEFANKVNASIRAVIANQEKAII